MRTRTHPSIPHYLPACRDRPVDSGRKSWEEVVMGVVSWSGRAEHVVYRGLMLRPGPETPAAERGLQTPARSAEKGSEAEEGWRLSRDSYLSGRRNRSALIGSCKEWAWLGCSDYETKGSWFDPQCPQCYL